MSIHFHRVTWSPRHGNWRLHHTPWSHISCKSLVFVSASEYEADEHGRGYLCDFTGDARFTVHNVSPFDGGVTVWLEINYDLDLPVRLDFLIINP